MKYRTRIEVEAWFYLEIEADSPQQASDRIVDRVDGITERLRAAGVTWLTTTSKDIATIVVTDEDGKRSVFESRGETYDDDDDDDDDWEEEEEEEEEEED